MAYIYRDTHSTINECLAKLGFGELKNPYLIHACGPTDTNIPVWLPLLGAQIPYNNCPVDNDTYIVERNDNDGVGNPPGETIIRERTGRCLYTYLGQYRVVLCDTNKHYKIHARIDTPDAQGEIKNAGDLCWLSGFASNESVAEEKLQGLIDLAAGFDRNGWLRPAGSI
jgi:hypothetical protein